MTEEGLKDATQFQSYNEARQWIEGLIPFGIRPGLERIALLLQRLGNPQRRLQFIHVAGTNGKGSVCAYLTQVLRQSGYDVGTYTSPYITKFTNRFQYNGEDIAEHELLRLTNQLKPHVQEIAATELGSPTMFEVSTALAILYYAQVTYPDYVVWETGLGGRMDVTNIVNPVISIITNVGHDHLDILGPELTDIAREKAGIIKPGVPVICGAAQPEVVEIMRSTASERNSTFYLLGEKFHESLLSSDQEGQSFRFDGLFRSIEPLTITMKGDHQRQNAALAVMTLEILRQYKALVLEDEDLREGLRAAFWPGRLEMAGIEPDILLDGAHNPEGAEALASALQSAYTYKNLHMMVGMLANKNHKHTLRHILPLVKTLIVTEPDFRKKLEAGELARIVEESFPDLTLELIVEPDWRRALQRLQAAVLPGELGVVTGTLYLIADVRSQLLNISDSEKGW